MRKKGYKGRCEKKNLSKSQEVCRTYDAIQSTYADILQNDNGIQEIRCTVLMTVWQRELIPQTLFVSKQMEI